MADPLRSRRPLPAGRPSRMDRPRSIPISAPGSPGPDHHFLINDYGVHFPRDARLRPRAIDLDGNVGGGRTPLATRQCGGLRHPLGAIHAARDDLVCVVHTHTAGIAVSASATGCCRSASTRCVLRPPRLSRLRRHRARSTSAHDSSPISAAHNAMILRNHGLLVGGRSVPEAWSNSISSNVPAQAQIAALAGGVELILPPERNPRPHRRPVPRP